MFFDLWSNRTVDKMMGLFKGVNHP